MKAFAEEQMVGVLKDPKPGAEPADSCPKPLVSEAPHYSWTAKLGGMTMSKLGRSTARRRAVEREQATYDAWGRLKAPSDSRPKRPPSTHCWHSNITCQRLLSDYGWP